MKKKLTILIIAIFLGLPSVSLAGSFVVSLIQGKTPAEAFQIIVEQVNSLLSRVDVLETKQSETTIRLSANDADIEKLKLENANLKLQNENLKIQSGNLEKEQLEQGNQLCGASFKVVPRTFNIPVYIGGLGENIVRYYTMSKFVIDNKLDFNQERLSEWQKLANESESLYTAFINKCPNYSTNEISTKTQWCIDVEHFPKCFQLYGAGHRPASELEQFLEVRYLESGCDQLLNKEAPNRDQYTCG